MIRLHAEQQPVVEWVRAALSETADEALSADAAIKRRLESVAALQQLLATDTVPLSHNPPTASARLRF